MSASSMTHFIQSSFSSRRRTLVALAIVWLFTIGIITYRLQTLGAFASVSVTELLEHAMSVSQQRPADLRLNQPYTDWAFGLDQTDVANYIRAGLGFADGKGVSYKNTCPERPNMAPYVPYYYQSPGAPVLIGTLIKLFGGKEVLPYFFVVLSLHFLSALLTCVLASMFLEGDVYVFGAGLLGLLCLPVLDYVFGFGLFSSEPLAAPFVGIALIAVSSFWKKLENGTSTFKNIFFTAVGFGSALALAAYCRDVYSSFAEFCFVVLAFVAFAKRGKFKQVLVFVLIAALTLALLEHPWRERNKHYYGQYGMTASTYYGYSMWYDMWDDYRERAKWGGDFGIGFANYLEPEKSAEVIAQLNKDPKQGSSYALRSLMGAIHKRPWDALWFKLSLYDHLWFGQARYIHVYLWCLLSSATFVFFLFMTRFRFIPGLWLFPLFLLCISPLIDFQSRFAQPFFLFVTPVTCMFVLKSLVMRRKAEPNEGNYSLGRRET
jgi:hypothetical protein